MRFIFVLFFFGMYSIVYAQVYIPVSATSKVSFKIRNFGSTVDGSIKGLKGTINFDGSTLSNTKFDVTINPATIDTGIGMRDNHLRKLDYFAVDDYPTIRFVSTKVMASGKLNEATVTGKLTIKKTTKEISFPFRYTGGNNALQFTGEFKINRRDFDVGGNSFSLSDEVTVILDVTTSK